MASVSSCLYVQSTLSFMKFSTLFINRQVKHLNRVVRVGLIYLVSGFGGSILSSLFLQESISVGASGALFGLLGAMLSELLTNWTIYANKVFIRPGRSLFGSFLSYM